MHVLTLCDWFSSSISASGVVSGIGTPFSLHHKLYPSDYDSDYDSVASENQPCPSYEGYILAVFPRELQKSHPFPLHVCVIAVAKQLSLQSILTALVFQLLEFFLPK